MQKEDKVYVVGDEGPEHNSILSIHKTRDSAVKAWNNHRLDLLSKAKNNLKRKDSSVDEILQRIIKNLSCEDPDKINNYPQDTPYIREYLLE